MKRKLIFIISVVCLLSFNCNKSDTPSQSEIQADKKLSLNNEARKTSYSMGYNMGKNFKEIYDKIDQESLIQGILDAVNQKDPQITMKEISDTLTNLQQKVAEKKREEQKSMAEENKRIGTQFLEENAKKAGVKTTSTGLQYKTISQGNGPKPIATDKVRVHYRGKFINGNEFDSSYKRGEPATFRLDQVISGWTEALQLMNKGAKFEVYIPSELAYGERGAGNVIAPNSTLIFEIELLEILKPESK
jgi:FKBP-type peptidyl-prolyl cis-trans isomerase FklB